MSSIAGCGGPPRPAELPPYFLETMHDARLVFRGVSATEKPGPVGSVCPS